MRPFRPPFRPNGPRATSSEEPETATRETNYLSGLVESKKPVVICLRSGETVRGYVEYYDKRFIRLTRQNAPNLFIFKEEIKYLYEE